MLQRVVRQMLPAFGEHHAVDLRSAPRADQRHVLIDLGQPCAERADGPLQAAVALDEAFLMGKMPDAVSPVLQIHVTQQRPAPTSSSMPPQCRAESAPCRRHAGPPAVSDRPSLRPRLPAPPGCDPDRRHEPLKRRERVKRPIDHHAARHVEQRAAGPAGGVQRGEFVVVRIHRPEQMRLHQLAMLGHKRVETAEQHAASGPFRFQLGRHDAAVEQPRSSRPVRRRGSAAPAANSPRRLAAG